VSPAICLESSYELHCIIPSPYLSLTDPTNRIASHRLVLLGEGCSEAFQLIIGPPHWRQKQATNLSQLLPTVIIQSIRSITRLLGGNKMYRQRQWGKALWRRLKSVNEFLGDGLAVRV
jgi:hypothetical protein